MWIFWGFLIITVGTGELVVNGVVPAFHLSTFTGRALYAALAWLIDLMNLVVLVMIGFAFFRRLVVRPRLIPMNLDAALVLGAIGGLMITHFLHHSMHALALGLAEVPSAPVSSVVAGALAGKVGPAAAHRIGEVAYWMHVVILLGFLNYLPYSKHIHLLGALPNILTMNLSERKLDVPKMNLEDENQWGVGAYEQFSWKSLLDTYACTECARCSNYCPAHATDKPLSPMQLVHDVRHEMLEKGQLRLELARLERELAALPPPHANGHGASAAADHGHAHDHADEDPERAALTARADAVKARLAALPPMVGGRIKDETLWACTMCGACQEACPVFIEHPLKILQMRQHLVLAQERVPADLARAFRNIERNSNPWGIGADQRMDWAEGLGVPTLADKPHPAYLLWVGCAGAFDQRIRKQTQAMVKILAAAGVDYAVLGKRECCTGDPARRSGNEMLFQTLAEQNVAILNAAGITKIITSCPHCLHTLRHDYPQFGGRYQVIHHTQLLDELIAAGRLTPLYAQEARVVFHDSCYLGRWNGEFEAPRRVLGSLPLVGGTLDPERARAKGFCCGAGGGRMFMEEHDRRVNRVRAEELVATGADTIAVACPFCNVMMTDGVKELGKEDDVRVLDVAEVVARTLPELHPDRRSVPVPPQREDGPLGPVAEAD